MRQGELRVSELTEVTVSVGSVYSWFRHRLYVQEVEWKKYSAPKHDESFRSHVWTAYWWIANESVAPGYVFMADLGPSDTIHDKAEVLVLYSSPRWPQQEIVNVHKVRYLSSYLVL